MNSIVHSARREARRLRQSPWDLAMITWVPLLAVALIWWIFSAGVPHDLPMGVPWLERSCRLGWILRKQFQRTIHSAGRTFRPVHAGLTR